MSDLTLYIIIESVVVYLAIGGAVALAVMSRSIREREGKPMRPGWDDPGRFWRDVAFWPAACARLVRKRRPDTGVSRNGPDDSSVQADRWTRHHRYD